MDWIGWPRYLKVTDRQTNNIIDLSYGNTALCCRYINITQYRRRCAYFFVTVTRIAELGGLTDRYSSSISTCISVWCWDDTVEAARRRRRAGLAVPCCIAASGSSGRRKSVNFRRWSMEHVIWGGGYVLSYERRFTAGDRRHRCVNANDHLIGYISILWSTHQRSRYQHVHAELQSARI